MNYFAHGFRFLGRPWFVAGTAVPDWLSVADRNVRIRRGSIVRSAVDGGVAAELAAGIVRHLDDDRRFHNNPVFVAVSRGITAGLREALGRGRYRLSFFGHVATELLLDSALIEEAPERLDSYYADLAEVDPQRLEELVGAITGTPTRRLASFVRRFLDYEFLRDYSDDERLLLRLNQVMRRIGLEPVPREAERVLGVGRETVRLQGSKMLPPEAPGS